MRPVRALLGNTNRLLISPDGSLNLIPFAALIDERGRYLVERYTFSYLSSGRDLLRLQATTQSKQGPLIIANPAFGERANAEEQRGLGLPPGEQSTTQSSLNQLYFRPLPGTAEEARMLKTIFPQSRLLTREEATETSLKQASGPSILHIATHGFFLNDIEAKPARERGLGLPDGGKRAISESQTAGSIEALYYSGLALAGANQRKSGDDDGILTALEATGLNLWGTKLVVLSACDTGVGEISNGEGVYGLRRALVLAGSESQVMSLWPVSDKSTQDLMVAYYSALAQGRGRSEALRDVQLKTLKSENRQHPFYWASFIQSGEWANLDGKR
jgi:CHAT domain-containing protein